MFLALGSNLGDREASLRRAVAALAERLEDLKVSSIYETRPMYLLDQPSFLNAVARGGTRMSPQELLRWVMATEAALGRQRRDATPMGPRTIDIDVLLYDARIIRTAELTVPHPRMRERQFVLVPLLELAPRLRDPESGRPYAEALAGLPDQGVCTHSGWHYTRPDHSA